VNVQPQNAKRAQDVVGYFARSTQLPMPVVETCRMYASELIGLIDSGGEKQQFIHLLGKMEKAGVADMGSAAHELLSVVKAIIDVEHK